jgi:leucyl aminopeptidase
MKQACVTGDVTTLKSECIIVGIHDGGKMTPSASAVDKVAGGLLAGLCKAGDFGGQAGETLFLHNVSGIASERVLLAGLGKEKEANEQKYISALNKAILAAHKGGASDALVCLNEMKIKGRDQDWMLRTGAQIAETALYLYEDTKSKKNPPKHPLKTVQWLADKSGDEAVKQGMCIGQGMNVTRTLGNLPGNICTPTYLAETAIRMADDFSSVKTTIVEEKDMEKLGMGALLSVSRGSRQPAKLIVMEYNGGKKDDKPVVLVGKGLTFDSGGISIKPSPAMDEMKYDMCGGASVFGTMEAIARMKLKLNVIGVVPSSENMPDGDANKPGDIVTSMAGKTIEVLNTDAEGRLILCDALTYVDKFKPAAVIDIATLTGACIIALGKHATGLLSNDETFAAEILNAGKQAHDRAWQLPLWEEYQEQLNTNFADMANVGGREAGTITAACFLARYTEDYTWAHLDIAGTAWNSGGDKGATGRPVPLLTQILMNRANA